MLGGSFILTRGETQKKVNALGKRGKIYPEYDSL
jgi:hypothetical protein